MATGFPTYTYGENGEVAAFHGNQVIAKGTDFSKVSETAEQYFETLRKAKEQKTADTARTSATHVITPNGAKGTILGRTSSWDSDKIAVRFENGQIRHFDTFAGDGLRYATEGIETPKSPTEYFQRRLDEMAEPGREGLTARLNILGEIRDGASRVASQGVGVGDINALHRIIVTAEAERREVQEALAYLADIDERIEAPRMAYTAVEQADLGRAKGDTWLDVIASDMINESEAQDFGKLLAEGPTLFVSNVDTAALVNSGVTAEMARDFIVSKTAGFQGKAVEDYRDQFVAATEMARRQEKIYRQDVVHKEAVTKEASLAGIPDESLFL